MRYTRASSIVRFGVVALIAGQLGGCATARGITRGAGTALGAAGALALLVAFEPSCDPDEELCPNDEPYYEEDTIETRAVIAASGGAAVVLGGALVAASSAPKRKARKRAPAAPVPARAAVAAPAPDPNAAAIRALVQKRCVPAGGIDLRVSSSAEEPLPELPACEISGLDQPSRAPVAPDSGAPPAR
jgi:hypothetical protein